MKGIAVRNGFSLPFLSKPSQDLGVISTSLFRFRGPHGAHREVVSAGTTLVILPTPVRGA